MLLACLGGAGPARAQEEGGAAETPLQALSPNRAWNLALSQAWLHDSNLLRRPSALQPMADTASITALDLGLRHAWGRQEGLLQGRLEHAQHAGSPILDHTAHRATAQWLGETVGGLSARVQLRSQSDLAPDDLRLDPLTGRRNEQHIGQGLLQLRWNAAGPLGLEWQRQHDAVRETADWSVLRNFRQTTQSLGLLWRSDGGSTAGVAWREVQGRQPGADALALTSDPDALDREGLPIVYRQRLMDAQLSWRDLNLRWTQGQGQRNGVDQDLGSLQAQGRLSWHPDWRLIVRVLRDRGQQSRILEPLLPTASLLALSALDTRDVRVDLSWEASPMLQFHASAAWTQRRWQQGLGAWIEGAQAITGVGELWQDRTQRARLGLRWTWRPAWSLSCQFGQDRRTAPQSLAVASGPSDIPGGWRAQTVMCGLRWAKD